MATVVFNNGNATGIWSDALNWVGGALPLGPDTADLNENCILDMDDIVAVLDVAAGKTFTMGSGGTPYDLTGMTGNCIGTGTIYMNAGCELTWNTAGDVGTATCHVTARGTSGARCLIDNVGAGRFNVVSAASWDCEYTDIHKINNLYPSTASILNRFVGCDIEGATSSGYLMLSALTVIVTDSWISNFDLNPGVTFGYDLAPRVRLLLRNITFGEDIAGNAQPNNIDLHMAAPDNFWAGQNIQAFSATPISWDAGSSPSSRWIADNWGFNSKHTAGSGAGTRGIGYIDTPFWSCIRSTSAKKAGDFGARVTPKAGIDTSAEHYGKVDIYIPIVTGDNIAVSVQGRRHTMTNDCAEVVIDPEGAWFTPNTSAPVLTTDDTWYEFTPSAAGAGGITASGMVRVVLRLKEYQAAAYFDWADGVINVTHTGGLVTRYLVKFENWSMGVPQVSKPDFALVADVKKDVVYNNLNKTGTYDPITGQYTDPGKANVLVGSDYTFAGAPQVAEFNEAARNTDPGEANVKDAVGYKILNVAKTGTLAAGGGSPVIGGSIVRALR